ncbi:flippase [Halorubellus litoreus]|uniref:Flippase n=1 Tax=Halorubellus litoreus TaxID=755308 RepID=A0ABD5VF91_9EURY
MSEVGGSLVELLKSAGLVFIGTIIGRFLALLGQILVVRSLSPDLYGTIALAFSIVASLSAIFVLGAPQGVARLIPANEDHQSQLEFLQSGLVIVIFGGVIGSITLYLSRYEIQYLMDSPKLASLLSIFSIYLLIFPIQRLLIGGLRGFKQSRERVLAKDIFAPSFGLIILYTFVTFGEGFLGAIVYFLIIPFLIIIGAIYFLKKHVSLSDLTHQAPSMTSISELLSFSWPLAISGSFVILMSQLDILMIGLFLPPRDVGLYRAVQPLKEVVLFFLTSFVFLYLPIATKYFTNNKYSELGELYRTSTKWIVTITFPIVLTSVLFANDIVRSLFGESYVSASGAFAILVVGMFTRVIVGPNGATIQAVGRTKVEMYASLVGLVANLGLNVSLIPLIGIEGAAVATSIGFLVYNIVEITVIYREVGFAPISKEILIPLIPMILVGGAVYQTLYTAELSLPLLFLVGLMFGFFQILSVIFTGSLRENDLFLLDQVENRIGINLSWLRSLLESQI